MEVEKYIAKNSQQCKELEDAVKILFNYCNLTGNGASNLLCEKEAMGITVRPSVGSIDAVAICGSIKNNPAKIKIASPAELYVQIDQNEYRVIYEAVKKN